MAQPTQTKYHSSRFENIETSDRSAPHFQRPSSLRKGLRSNIPTKASPCTMLEDGTSYHKRRHLVPCKAASRTMLGVISYHRVLVMLAPQRVLVDVGFAKGTDDPWMPHRMKAVQVRLRRSCSQKTRRREKSGQSQEVNKAWKTAGIKTPMECSSENAYVFPRRASESLSTTSLVNVKLNDVFYLRISHKNLFQFDYTLIGARALEERQQPN